MRYNLHNSLLRLNLLGTRTSNSRETQNDATRALKLPHSRHDAVSSENDNASAATAALLVLLSASTSAGIIRCTFFPN